ncbi:heme oxygenase-like protein [Crassisporium funariophilum]|nr:heme oxygenase-like protein [Crassisporium funariophilum]
MTSCNLTKHLLSIDIPSYVAATQHTFLDQAGKGTLPLPRLALWLSQDRIYAAHAYPRFIGSLITRIPFQDTDAIAGPREQRNQDILRVLVKCLDNIVREIDFFRDVAEKDGLDMEGWVERKGTRDYTAEMARIAAGGDSFMDGLIFLWAMERVYFDAWSYVKQLQSALQKSGNDDSDHAVPRFAENWSSPEFEAFVKELADLVDSLGISPGTREWARAEEIWTRVVELEVGFWPNDEEEARMMKKKI